MTRKDFEIIAKGLNDAKPIAGTEEALKVAQAFWRSTCYCMAETLTKTNTRFDSERFLKACGVE